MWYGFRPGTVTLAQRTHVLGLLSLKDLKQQGGFGTTRPVVFEVLWMLRVSKKPTSRLMGLG